MPYSNYSATYTTSNTIRFAPRATLAMGGVGAVIGGTVAAAKNIRRVNNGEIKREEAVKNTIKEAAGTGLASAAATGLITATGATGLLSLAGIVAIATGSKYLWDSSTGNQPAAETPKEEKPKPAAKSKPSGQAAK